MPNMPAYFGRDFSDVAFHAERLGYPASIKKPTTFFVNSMSDMFHEGVSNAAIEVSLDVMRGLPRHVFIMLTKRSARMNHVCHQHGIPENIWLGVSVEHQQTASRIESLKCATCFHRIVSFEPLIGPVEADLRGIDLIIIGGESGTKARKMEKSWVESLIAQSERDDCKVFFKQWGMFGEDGLRVRSKKDAGRTINGRTYDELPWVIKTHDT